MKELRFLIDADGPSDGVSLVVAVTAVAGVVGVDLDPATKEVRVRGQDVDAGAIREILSSGFRLDHHFPQAVEHHVL